VIPNSIDRFGVKFGEHNTGQSNNNHTPREKREDNAATAKEFFDLSRMSVCVCERDSLRFV